jgi:methionine-S-sulfoxide reductase
MLRRQFTSLIAVAALASASWLGAAVAQTPGPAGKAIATFGSGCFWCTESDFDKVAGVLETTSGYMGGTVPNPTYDMVSSGKTGAVEIVQVTYDPAKVTYKQLLDTYWKNVDPFDGAGQFCDKGTQYRPVIYTHSPEQKQAAEASKAEKSKELAVRFKEKVAVSIEDARVFTPAEAYHQDFYKKNASHYQRYRTGCGRDIRLRQVWGAPVTN